jgi:site-specific DNA recombinase
MDHYVWNQISNWLNKPEEIAAAAEKMMTESVPRKSLAEEEIERLKKEIAKAKEGRKRLLRLFAAGVDLSEEEIRQEIRELSEQEGNFRKQLHEMIQLREENEQTPYSLELIKEASEYYFNQGKDELTFEDQQEIIRQVVKEMIVYEERVEIYTF